ncbi:hypothetical protein LTR95_013005 [Oleoguttula sp. CCFEE 5521]
MSDQQQGLPQPGSTMQMAFRPIVAVQRSGVLFSLRALATPRQAADIVDVAIPNPTLSDKEIEVLRVSFVLYSAYIWDNVASLSAQSRVFFAEEVLKASAPTWKCEIFANEGVLIEDEWERGYFEDPRSIFTTAQYRAIKERLETEIEKCWFEVASEMTTLTERDFEISEVKALYEQYQGGKPGAEAGIVNGMASMEV